MLNVIVCVPRHAPPEIWETEEDKLLSVNKLKEKNIEYARTHFMGLAR